MCSHIADRQLTEGNRIFMKGGVNVRVSFIHRTVSYTADGTRDGTRELSVPTHAGTLASLFSLSVLKVCSA